jgi:hypothetical protein
VLQPPQVVDFCNAHSRRCKTESFSSSSPEDKKVVQTLEQKTLSKGEPIVTSTLSLTSILEIRNLSSGAHHALLGLLSFRNRATGQCNPRLKKLAERLGGVPDTTIRRWLRELRLAGIVATVRHRGSSSYVFHMPVFHAVENAEAPAASPSKNGRSTPSKNGRSRPSKNGRSQPPHPYMNQNLFEQTEGNGAAALRTGTGTAAAAPPPPVQKESEHERGVARPVSQQLGLGLEPVDPIRAEAIALVEELHAEHPQPGLPDKAVGEVQAILAASADVTATVEQIRINHAAWKLHWEMLRPGAFIPQLWRWFHDGEWKRTVGKPVRHENFYERCEREWTESRPTEEQSQQREYEAERERRERQEQQEEYARQQRERNRQLRELANEPWPEDPWIKKWEKKHGTKKLA